MVADDPSQLDKLKKFYHTDKDLDGDGRVTRTEFYYTAPPVQHEEL